MTNPASGSGSTQETPPTAPAEINPSLNVERLGKSSSMQGATLPDPHPDLANVPWWQKGVIYQIYPRSFQDSDGDGIGDLRGVINRLDDLKKLGVDAIWLSPFYKSPLKDFGYDIADYTAIAPEYGTLATFDEMVEAAHARDIKVIIDYVPNHTSDEHDWFEESRMSRDNPRADWYIWRDARPDRSRPNNWGSMFGGPAWTWDETRQQYYFHQFDPGQPDLNWRNPEVQEAMLNVLRFWMRHGVDGFRMDVVYMIWKHPDMPDQPPNEKGWVRGEDDIFGHQQQIYAFNYEGIHDVMRSIRQTLDEHDAMAVGEIWLDLKERMKYYGNNDELHLPFNFGLIPSVSFDEKRPLKAEEVRQIIEEYEAALPAGAWGNWVMGSHDVSRVASRVGGEAAARIAAMLLLTLRGTPTIYQGEEIGMTNGVLQSEHIRDPQGIRLGAAMSRDRCRTPMQWEGVEGGGFTEGDPWLPLNEDHLTRSVANLRNDPRSIYTLYQRLLALRHSSAALSIGSYKTLPTTGGLYAYERAHGDERYQVWLNMSEETLDEVPLHEEGRVVLTTYLDMQDRPVAGLLPLRPWEGMIIRVGAQA